MNKQEYKKYLKSKHWLLKKNEFINNYVDNDGPIQCHVCKTDEGLQVHHTSYENLGNEDIRNDLQFMCGDCHYRWHFEKGFKENFERVVSEWFDKNFDEIVEYFKNVKNDIPSRTTRKNRRRK